MKGAREMPSESSVSRKSRRCIEGPHGGSWPDSLCPRNAGATKRKSGRRSASLRKTCGWPVTPCSATRVRPAPGPNSCTCSRIPPSWANAGRRWRCFVGLLDGKRALVMGVGNQRSIAWGIATAFQREGAQLAFNYATERLRENVEKLVVTLPDHADMPVLPCDVSKQEEIDAFFKTIGER